MFAIPEGVRQLRGEAAAQIDSPQVSVVLGNGGMFATAGVLVLGRAPRAPQSWSARARRRSTRRRRPAWSGAIGRTVRVVTPEAARALSRSRTCPPARSGTS